MSVVTQSKTKNEIKTLVIQAVQEILSDPDFGLKLSEKAKKRLLQANTSKGKTAPLSEIKKKYY